MRSILVWALVFTQSPAQQLRALIGQHTTVCGRVTTYDYGAPSRGRCSIRFDVAAPSWEPRFYFVLPESLVTTAPVWPEAVYVNEEVCVTGMLAADARKVPFIEVTPVENVVRKSAAATRPAFATAGLYRSCDGRIVAPKVVKEIVPEFPGGFDTSRDRPIVVLDVIVGVDGRVATARTIFSAYAPYADASERAVRQWRFKPGTLDGAAVPVLLQIEMTFSRQ